MKVEYLSSVTDGASKAVAQPRTQIWDWVPVTHKYSR